MLGSLKVSPPNNEHSGITVRELLKSLLCGVRTCGWEFESQGNAKTLLLEDALFRFLIPGADVDRPK